MLTELKVLQIIKWEVVPLIIEELKTSIATNNHFDFQFVYGLLS